MTTKATQGVTWKNGNQNDSSVLFFPTLRCNLSCSYCQYRLRGDTLTTCNGASWRIGKELDPGEWLKFFRQYAPLHLEICGGEPTIYPGLERIVAGLPDRCTWAITSNGLRQIGHIPAERASKNIGYTITVHLEYPDRIAEVMANAKALKRTGYPVKLTTVVTPDLMHRAERFVPEWRKHFLVHVHPAALLGELDWSELPDEWKRVRRLAGEGLVQFPRSVAESPYYQRCTAGDKHYWFQLPDGQILRCLSQMFCADPQYQKPIGTVWDFKPYERPMPCYWPHVAICDERTTEQTNDGKGEH